MVSVSTSRSRDGLETYRRSRLGLVSGMQANVSVSSRSRELRSRSWPRSRQFRSRAQVAANHIFLVWKFELHHIETLFMHDLNDQHFVGHHAKCPMSAPPIEVKSCTKSTYYSFICMYILNIESIKPKKFIVLGILWVGGRPQPLIGATACCLSVIIIPTATFRLLFGE